MPETVTLIRTTDGPRDRLGVPTEGETEEIEICDVQVALGATDEVTVGQDTTSIDLTLYMPPGDTVPAARDRMRVRGDTYEVIGQPFPWGTSGIQVHLGRSQ